MSNGTTETTLYSTLLDAIIAVGYRAISIMQQTAAKIQTIDGKQDIIGQQSADQLPQHQVAINGILTMIGGLTK